jgi:hypothetical protein
METAMITAIVQFSLPKPINLEEAARAFESTAPKYPGLQGLVRKYYLLSEAARRPPMMTRAPSPVVKRNIGLRGQFGCLSKYS